MKVEVMARAAVERGAAEGADGIISIRPSAIEAEPDLDAALAAIAGSDDSRLLRLRFDDIGLPRYRHYAGPRAADIAAALDFARHLRRTRDAPRIVVHCEFGKSRSAAIALALRADHAGVGQEETTVADFLAHDPEGRMHPNPLIVAEADRLLGRNGRLDAALADASPAYVKWRDLWRRIAADPDHFWEIAQRALNKRGGIAEGAAS